MAGKKSLTGKQNPTQGGEYDAERLWHFVEVPPFVNDRDGLFKGDDNYRKFQIELMADPEQWKVCSGTGILRKARWGDKKSGKGKSGGIRVIYLQVPEVRVIVLLHGFPKSDQENLTDAETAYLGKAAKVIRESILDSYSRTKKK